jgi:hypothetical protein
MTDLEVVVADKRSGRKAERAIRGLFRSEAGQLPGAHDDDLAHAALAEIQIQPTQDPGDEAPLGVERRLFLLVEIKEVVVHLGGRLAQRGGDRAGRAVEGFGGEAGELVQQARGKRACRLCGQGEKEQVLRPAAGGPAGRGLGQRPRRSGQPRLAPGNVDQGDISIQHGGHGGNCTERVPGVQSAMQGPCPGCYNLVHPPFGSIREADFRPRWAGVRADGQRVE